MRVHLHNVVYSAIERGVVMGHHRVSKLSRQKQKDPDVIVDTMIKSIWESLDGIIDFTDEGAEEEEEERSSRIGFTADAVADSVVDTEEKYEEESDEVLPLETKHRIHRYTR